jgi:hypothetical protein
LLYSITLCVLSLFCRSALHVILVVNDSFAFKVTENTYEYLSRAATEKKIFKKSIEFDKAMCVISF